MTHSNEGYQQSIYETIDCAEYQAATTAPTLIRIVGRRIVEPVLDVGAADGSLVRALRRRGLTSVEGVDLTPRAEFIRQGSITALPYPDASFRTVICTEVIEHLESDQVRAGLAEIARVLDPGGRFVATVPFDEVLAKNTLSCPECKCRFHRYGHRQTFTRERFGDLLAGAGFAIESSKVYALGAMAVLPLGRYFNPILKRLRYEFISNTIVTVARRA